MKEALRKPEHIRRFSYKDISFFLRFIRPAWKLGVTGLFLSCMVTGLDSLLPLGSKVLIDFIILNKGGQKIERFLTYINLESLLPSVKHFLASLNLVVLSMLILGALIGVLSLIQKYLMMRFQQELTFNIQTSLFDHLLRFPLSFFKKKQSGYLVSRVSDDINALQYLFSQSISEIVTKTLLLLFGIIILFTLSVKLTVMLIVILPLSIVINYYFAGRLRDSSMSEMEATAQVSKDLQEVISGVELIKAHTSEDREVAKVSGTLRTAMQSRIQRSVLLYLSHYSSRGIQLLITLMIMWFGAHEIFRNTMTIGDYVAFTSYLIILSSAVHSLSLFHIMLQPLFAALERLMELFRTIPEVNGAEKQSLKKPDSVIGEIAFNNVSFAYDENHPVLRNISFTAQSAEVVALVGPSGAGKTTLINLLLKFYLPGAGTITLDGHDLRELDPQWLRQQIAVVSQDTFLFNDTIEHNIKYGNIHATGEEIIDAAKAARIHDDITGFNDGYETVVGERGVTLSAGQRQRISIARAFLKNPAILIFDEPSSALDPATEHYLRDSLNKLSNHKTMFIISHRFSTIDVAHTIVVLDRGEIRERGTHQDLLDNKGLYHTLFAEHHDEG